MTAHRCLAIALLLAGSARAEFDEHEIAQLEAFALKWERDAATLMSGQLIGAGGGRQEQMGTGLGLLRAADDIRKMLNRPIARTRANTKPPWPETDQRGTPKLLELLTPGYSIGPTRAEPARPAPPTNEAVLP